jgi:nucleotide-binding universal stress UspA family protein
MTTIVVGVDGSEGSLQALRWAADEARLRKALLQVVLAWDYPASLFAGASFSVPDLEILGDFGKLAEARLGQALQDASSALEGVEVERRVIEGAPALALIEAAKGADLLVVGTRGHGGFVGLLLGSVSQQCAHHAPCPIVIVPPAKP